MSQIPPKSAPRCPGCRPSRRLVMHIAGFFRCVWCGCQFSRKEAENA